jgi:hypothetical protein
MSGFITSIITNKRINTIIEETYKSGDKRVLEYQNNIDKILHDRMAGLNDSDSVLDRFLISSNNKHFELSKRISNMLAQDEFRFLMENLDDFPTMKSSEELNEIYLMVLHDTIYICYFLDKYPLKPIELLQYIHDNKLIVSEETYFTILEYVANIEYAKYNYNDDLNSLMQDMFPYLPNIIALYMCGTYNLKYEGVDQHIVELLNKISKTNYDLFNIILNDGISIDYYKPYIEQLIFSINSIELLNHFYDKLNDSFIVDNLEKFSLTALKYLICIRLENETIEKVRDRMIELNYFNPKNFRMLSNETKIKYLEKYFQVEEDGSLVGYVSVTPDNIVVTYNSSLIVTVDDEKFRGKYMPYENSDDVQGMDHMVNVYDIKRAYQHIKNGHCIIEVIMDIKDISYSYDMGEFISQSLEFNEFPMASQLNQIMNDKYNMTFEEIPVIEPLIVSATSELMRFSNDYKVDNNIIFEDYDIDSLTSSLVDYMKTFNLSNDLKHGAFIEYANLLMKNAKFLMDYPHHLKLFIDKCLELSIYYPAVYEYIPLVKSTLCCYLDTDPKYKQSDILAKIFEFEIDKSCKNDESSDEEIEIVEEQIFDIMDSPAKTMPFDTVKNFIDDIRTIINETDIKIKVSLLNSTCFRYLRDGGLWKLNDSILSQMLPLLNECVDHDPIILECINKIQKYRYQIERESNDNKHNDEKIKEYEIEEIFVQSEDNKDNKEDEDKEDEDKEDEDKEEINLDHDLWHDMHDIFCTLDSKTNKTKKVMKIMSDEEDLLSNSDEFEVDLLSNSDESEDEDNKYKSKVDEVTKFVKDNVQSYHNNDKTKKDDRTKKVIKIMSDEEDLFSNSDEDNEYKSKVDEVTKFVEDYIQPYHKNTKTKKEKTKTEKTKKDKNNKTLIPKSTTDYGSYTTNKPVLHKTNSGKKKYYKGKKGKKYGSMFHKKKTIE